jgi:hypothetical protein
VWKQWNKLKDRFTADMDEEELDTHYEVLRLIQKYLQFTQQNEANVKSENDE